MPLAPPTNVLARTPIYRMVHIDCLDTLLSRNALHAPSVVPRDGLPYTGIHAVQTQADRGKMAVVHGPGGVIRDYIGFYFGPRSPMLYRVHTGYNVQQVDQSNIVYLTTTAQAVDDAGFGYVFTDRHSLTRLAKFKDHLDDLEIVDFPAAYAILWKTTPQHPDRQEKKQSEFLVHESMQWSLIDQIGVLNNAIKTRVMAILDNHPRRHRPSVLRKPSWYY